MNKKLIIPTPLPANFNQEQFGVVGALAAIVRPALPPTPAQAAIERFLTGMPQPQARPVETLLPVPPVGTLADVPSFIPKFIKPSLPNNMTQVGGLALNNTPLFANLEIKGFSGTSFNGNTIAYADMVFDTVLMTVQQQKNIVETEIQGSDDGAVFEYSGMNNYEVTLNIVITSGFNGVYPQGGVQGVEELLKALTSPYPISVSSWYLQMLDIHQLVIKDYDLAQAEGSISQQAITIHAKSNKNTVLIIT